MHTTLCMCCDNFAIYATFVTGNTLLCMFKHAYNYEALLTIKSEQMIESYLSLKFPVFKGLTLYFSDIYVKILKTIQ